MSQHIVNSSGNRNGNAAFVPLQVGTAPSEDFQARMGQILDDQDHKRCSEGNHRALLAENLDRLRSLLKVLEADNWKYAPASSKSAHPFQSESDFSSSVPPRW